MSTTSPSGAAAHPVEKAGAGAATFVDQRLGSNKFLSKNLSKVFPEHWSFMLGEIALYSFIVVLLTGTYLTLFYKPSMAEVLYVGTLVEHLGHAGLVEQREVGAGEQHHDERVQSDFAEHEGPVLGEDLRQVLGQELVAAQPLIDEGRGPCSRLLDRVGRS